MKDFIWEKYGPPESLRMAEVEKPALEADEVLSDTSIAGATTNRLGGLVKEFSGGTRNAQITQLSAGDFRAVFNRR